MTARISRSLRFLAALAILAAFARPAAAAPSISNLSLRGLQAGGTTLLVIEGTELLPEPRLLSSAPIGKQALRPNGTPQKIEMEVSVDAQASPGIYLLRLASASGVSNAVAMAIENIPQSAFAPQVTTLPVAMSGRLSGSEVLTTTFVGKAGQKIVVDVESRRLGAGLNPAVHIYNPRHVQLAWSQPLRSIAGDARCAAVLPADGPYTVELHDVLYRGEGSGFFCLKIGELLYADLVYPLGVTQGAKTPLTYVSTNLPPTASQPAPAGSAAPGVRPAPWPAGMPLAGGSRPGVTISDYAEVSEGPPQGGKPQDVPAAPLAINGRIAAPGEVDRYRLPVTAGQRLQFEVFANRVGSALDGVLAILDEAGHELATNDDRPDTNDPGLEFTVPANAKFLLVSLRDLRGAGGPDFIYRIVVRPVEMPDFALSLVEDRQLVPRGSVSLLRVRVERKHYDGLIKLSFQGMPTQVTVAGDTIPAGASEALITLTAADAAPAAGLITVLGETVGLTPPLKRTALVALNQVSRQQPWLAAEAAVAMSGPAPMTIAWDEPSADAKIMAGSSFAAGVHVTRAAGAVGPVRVSVVSSQPMSKKTTKVNGKDQTADDPTRVLHIDNPQPLAAADSQAKFKIVAPAELFDMAYDLAIQGELLSADGKSVLGTAVTPVRRLTAERPMTLEIAQQKIDVPAGVGAKGKITGKLTRKPGFAFPATISLVNLPANVASPTVVIPADKNEFELEVAFDFGTPAADLAGVKVAATSQTDPKDALALVHSNEAPLAVKVVPGTKPPAQKPYLIFEDEADFVAKLTQGTGTATLLTDERYSGPVSLKVTPDQKSNPAIPGMSVKIRQHPSAPDEYRYVQFAWKKLLGTTICLQIGHDGLFGPVPGNPAKFRYHAGGGVEPLGASLSVNRNYPTTVTLVTRDLFADFGEFTFTGVGLAPIDGDFGLFDHIYLGKTPSDFDLAPAAGAK